MKRIFLLLIMLTSGFFSFAEKGWDVAYTSRSNAISLDFNFDKQAVSTINLNGINYTQLDFKGGVNTNKKGWAELPYVHASLRIDNRNNYSVRVTGSTFEDIKLEYPLVPSRGTIYRDQDIDKVPYSIKKESIVNEWYPANIIKSSEPFILRTARGINVYTYPYQYNAATNTIRVYTSISIELVENNTPSINTLESKERTRIREEVDIYNNVFLNARDFVTREDGEVVLKEFGDILVLTTPRDEEAIDPYIEWKRQKGFKVEKKIVGKGTNAKLTIKNNYDKNPDLLYVLLVGDYEDIKSDNNVVSGDVSPMDPMLGCVAGDDYYIDLIIGRFSANYTSDVTNQVNKTISYEKSTSGDHFSHFIGIASDEGGGSSGDDRESDIRHMDVIWKNKLSTFTYTRRTKLYQTENATSGDVSDAINSGAGFLEYAGHGSAFSFMTTGFSTSSVISLTNDDKYPFVVSVACVNGKFDVNRDCLAEAMVKKDKGGAIAFLGSTINQPWDPPMRGQDYFNDMLIGGYNYDENPGSGLNISESRTTFGSLAFNALVLMYTESNTTSDLETIQTWTIFGDPSLQVRTATPKRITTSSDILIASATYTDVVTHEDKPIEGLLVSLEQNGTAVTGFTNSNGEVSIEHPFTNGNVNRTITGFNYATLISEIPVTNPNDPFVNCVDITINDSKENNNNTLEYGEVISLNFVADNVGGKDASKVTAEISSLSKYVEIIKSTHDLGDIASKNKKTIENAFSIKIKGDVPNKENIRFKITCKSGSRIWNKSVSFKAYNANVFVSEYNTSFGDKIINPKDKGKLILKLSNTGDADVNKLKLRFIPRSKNVVLTNNTITIDKLIASDNIDAEIEFTTLENTPEGFLANIDVELSDDKGLMVKDKVSFVIGRTSVLMVSTSKNKNSPDTIEEVFKSINLSYERVDSQELPDNIDKFKSIWIFEGMSPNSKNLTSTSSTRMENYLNNGGNVYYEGGDAWCYGTQSKFKKMFNIQSVSDGTGNLKTILGLDGTITEGLELEYKGINKYIDRVTPINGAKGIFKNKSPEYICGVSFSNDTYKTVGTCFELGEVVGKDVKAMENVLRTILEFFGINPDASAVSVDKIDNINLSLYPNPVQDYVTLRYSTKESVSISIFDINGQRVSEIYNQSPKEGEQTVRISTADLKSGVYFYQIVAGNNKITKKVIKL
ncbi:MAG: C25 family cysteine peptidase [Hyphomicrobiales bacterium]